MARLMILREDFMLELRGLYATSISALDTHSDAWRRMYFFRSAVRTLWEIQGTLTTIRSNPEFKRIFRGMSPKEQNTIRQISSRLNAAAAPTREIRNAMGGHVLPDAVSRALDNLAYERFGVLEFGAVIGTTHYKVAGELIAEMLVTGVPEKQKMAKLEATMRTMADLLANEAHDQVMGLWRQVGYAGAPQHGKEKRQ
jgi:hypothetical protein